MEPSHTLSVCQTEGATAQQPATARHSPPQATGDARTATPSKSPHEARAPRRRPQERPQASEDAPQSSRPDAREQERSHSQGSSREQ